MLEIEEFTEHDKSTMLFSGELSVANGSALQQQLLKAASKVLHVDVKVTNVENMDLSFLQLLLAWAQSMKQSGKNLIFDFQLDQEFVRIFDESGFRQAFSQF
jgi:anti-anti-sigma factor